MDNHRTEYEFLYMNNVLYCISIIVFCLLWWPIPLLLIRFDLADKLLGNLPSIWIPFYMIAGIIIPSFAFIKPCSFVGKAYVGSEDVDIRLKYSQLHYDYSQIQELRLSTHPKTRGIHIRFSRLNEKVIAPVPGKEYVLYPFYEAVRERYDEYKSR